MTVVNSATATAVPFTYSPSTAMPAGMSVPMDSDTILMFCQQQLSHMDQQIGQAMKTQKNAVDLQDTITGLQARITGGVGDDGVSHLDGGDLKGDANGQAAEQQIEAALRAQANTCLAAGDKATSDKLNAAADQLHGLDTNDDATGLNSDELKQVAGSLDSVNTTLRSQAEMSMLDLQSIVQQRATLLTQTTNVMQGLAQPQQTITGNMKG